MHVGDFLKLRYNDNAKGIIKGCGALALTNENGNALPSSATSPSWFKLTFTGLGTQYAYINTKLNGSSKFILDNSRPTNINQANIRIVSTNNVTITFALEMNIKDAISDSENWRPLPAYDNTFTGTAQKVNTVYQSVEAIYDTPTRISIQNQTDSATVVWLQVTS